MLILGLCLGVGFSISPSISVSWISIGGFYVVDGCVKIGSLFLNRLLCSCFINGVLMLFSLTIFLLPCNIIIIFFRGYYFGALAVLTITEFSLGGIIILIFVCIPQQLLFSAVVIISACRSLSVCLNGRRYGGCFCFLPELKFYLWMLLCHLIITIFECILVALIVNPLLI